jgi:hypothetical protein
MGEALHQLFPASGQVLRLRRCRVFAGAYRRLHFGNQLGPVVNTSGVITASAGGFLGSPTAVSLLAIQYAGDLKKLALIPEENAVILGAKPDHRRFDALKLLCIALSASCVAGQSFENPQGGPLFNRAQISPGLFG